MLRLNGVSISPVRYPLQAASEPRDDVSMHEIPPSWDLSRVSILHEFASTVTECTLCRLDYTHIISRRLDAFQLRRMLEYMIVTILRLNKYKTDGNLLKVFVVRWDFRSVGHLALWILRLLSAVACIIRSVLRNTHCFTQVNATNNCTSEPGQ